MRCALFAAGIPPRLRPAGHHVRREGVCVVREGCAQLVSGLCPQLRGNGSVEQNIAVPRRPQPASHPLQEQNAAIPGGEQRGWVPLLPAEVASVRAVERDSLRAGTRLCRPSLSRPLGSPS